MKFCNVCGQPVEAASPTAPAPAKPAQPEILKPAAAPPAAGGGVKCAKCGKQVPAGMKFCNSCGQPVGAAPVMTPPPVQAPAPLFEPPKPPSPQPPPPDYAVGGPSPYERQPMSPPPAPAVRKGGGVGMIAGLVLAAAVLAVGGYFGYKRFFGPKEPAQEVAQVQQQQEKVQPGFQVPAQTPLSGVDQAQPPASSGSVQETPSQFGQPTPPLNSPPSTRSEPAAAPSRPMPQNQPPVHNPPAQQQAAPSYSPPAPAYTPPPTSGAPVTQPSQQQATPEGRSFPPAPVTQTPPQTTAPAPSAPAAPATPRYTGPSSGMLMWLGKLDKNGVVTIEGNRASAGTLTGSLPGVPVTLETDLTNIGFAEMPGPSNAWKRVVLRSKKSQNIVISIRWKVLN